MQTQAYRRTVESDATLSGKQVTVPIFGPPMIMIFITKWGTEMGDSYLFLAVKVF